MYKITVFFNQLKFIYFHHANNVSENYPIFHLHIYIYIYWERDFTVNRKN